MNVSTFMEQLKSQLQSLLYYWCVSVNLFPDHGFHHCERVLNYANKLLDELVKISHGRVYDLYEEENFLLKISAYVHDIGMLCGRENHSIHSANIIKACLPSTLMQLNQEEREVLSEIVKRHSSKMPIHDLDPVRTIRSCFFGRTEIRPQLLAILLRLADELDISNARIDEHVYRILSDHCDKRLLTGDARVYWIMHRITQGPIIQGDQQGNLIIQINIDTSGLPKDERDEIILTIKSEILMKFYKEVLYLAKCLKTSYEFHGDIIPKFNIS